MGERTLDTTNRHPHLPPGATPAEPGTEAPGEGKGPDGRAPSDAAGPAKPGPRGGASATGGRGPGVGVTWAGVLGVTVGVPLVVALVVLRQPRWYPGMDLALTELLVRDVGTADTPMTGLIGRFHALGRRGSHPGPLSFWFLAPFYRLFGSSAWALQAAAATLNLIAAGLTLWIAQRRGGRVAVLGVSVALVVLARTYGADKLTEAWNPHLPLLWWMVFLLAVWSVLCDDLVLLPVVVLAGSFCAQTHVSYVALGGGVGAVMVGYLAVTAWRDPTRRRHLLRWALPSLGLLALLWLAPVAEQLTSDPGNLAVLRENFTFPDEPPAGWKAAADVWLSYLDVPALLGRHDVDLIWARRGSAVPGGLLLAAWAATAVLAWRRRQTSPELLRLHVVVAAALVVGLVSVARILGILVYWVVLWLWGTTVLVLLAIGWTLAVVWKERERERAPAETAPPAQRRSRPWLSPGVLGPALLGVALVAGAARFTWESAHVRSESEGNDLLAPLVEMAPATVAALRSGEVPGGGLDGRYELRWPDAGGTFDAPAYGLVLELEREGFDVRTPQIRSEDEVPYRWADGDDPPATAFVELVVGAADIERWQDRSDAVEVASFPHESEPKAIFVLPAP